MDDSRARQLLQLARAADARRGRAGDSSIAALRAVAHELGPAAATLVATNPGEALELAAALGGFWQDAGLVDDGRTITRAILRDAGAIRGRALARARAAGAELAFRQGDQAEATLLATAAIDAASEAGDGSAAAEGWLVLARVAFRDGDAAAIEASSMAAVDAAPGDDVVRRGALHMLAWAAHTAGDIPEARRRFEASLAHRRATGAGELSEVVEIANLADLDLDAGDLASAAAAFRSILEAARRLDNRYLLVNTLPSVAALAAAAGSDVQAAVLFGGLTGLAAASGMAPDPGGDRADARDAVAARLGEAAFAGALAEGEALSIDAAIDLAMAMCDGVPPVGSHG